MLRIGLLTSGGDCQALNATMRGVVKGLANNVKDLEVYGFMNGYKGLIYSDYRMLSAKDFSGILTQGGTILGTSRQPFKLMRTPEGDAGTGMAATNSVRVRTGNVSAGTSMPSGLLSLRRRQVRRSLLLR